MDKKAVLLERNKISRLLGTQTEDDNLERNIFLLKSLDRQKDIVDIIAKVYVLIKDGKDSQTFEDIRNEVRELIQALDKYQETLGKEFRVFVSNFPDAVREVKISNAQDLRSEHPKEIRVSNLKEIKPKEFPDEVSIKRPVWYKEFDFGKLFNFFKDSSEEFWKQLKAIIFNSFVKNTKPKEAIPVRLVTEDGEKFYRAGNVYVGGGSDGAILAELRKLIGFEIPAFDYIALTYVSSGNGQGEIETVTYKKGGVSGTAVAVLTLAYNPGNEIATITRN
ncbi:MAG: hypothetical protein PHC29_02170 [Candidatus Omnitrophica bacterium]|nr:hypothetical protein [Candidatus Omnitrophota bacterium]